MTRVLSFSIGGHRMELFDDREQKLRFVGCVDGQPVLASAFDHVTARLLIEFGRAIRSATAT